jgi:hypothetical protein
VPLRNGDDLPAGQLEGRHNRPMTKTVTVVGASNNRAKFGNPGRRRRHDGGSSASAECDLCVPHREYRVSRSR